MESCLELLGGSRLLLLEEAAVDVRENTTGRDRHAAEKLGELSGKKSRKN